VGPAADDSIRAEELTAILREVRERVRARYPQTSAGPLEVPLADLMPIVHARDAAEAKVAAIGSVNPRAGGPLNAVIQWAKRLISRALDWHVRDQVEFNRNVLVCVEATMEAINEVNRALIRMGEQVGHQLGELRSNAERLEAEANELKDIRHHWPEWRRNSGSAGPLPSQRPRGARQAPRQYPRARPRHHRHFSGGGADPAPDPAPHQLRQAVADQGA
jgi:hypothetical protein